MKKTPKHILAATLAGVGLAAISIQISNQRQTVAATDQSPGSGKAHSPSPQPAALPFTEPERVADEDVPLFSDIGNLQKGSTVRLPLPGGRHTEGTINYAKTHPNGATAAGGILADGSGTFEIAREPGSYHGFILQKKDRAAYVYSSDTEDKLQVSRRPLGEVICEPDPNWKAVAQTEAQDPSRAPIYNDGRSVGVLAEPIPILHSLPRAEATIYLDFDGEVIEGQSWEGGARIVAPAHNLTAAQVTDMWRRVAEDFAPYEVNVTTDLQAYLRAPQGRRMRCITTTNNFASAGGVAFNSTFLRSGDTCCWNFYSGNAGALVISHEVGHTFNLAHDDTTTAGYYGGHGSGSTSWGPIMGAPYNQNVCQWSKGDYTNANQQQDDLLIIGAATPMRQDDHASTADHATPLTLGAGGAVSNTGVIASPDDLDRFIFTTGGGPLNLNFTGAPGSPNLDIEVKLYDSIGTLISTASPANQLSATLSTTLSAGTYTFTVDGVGNGTWASNGYDDYGSLGAYTISGTVSLPSWRFRVPVNALASAALGTVAPGTGSSYSITAGNSNSAFAINPTTGVITVATPSALSTASVFNLTIAYSSSGVPMTTTVPVTVAPARGVKEEIYTGLSGNGISGLTSNSNYPNNPAVTRYSPIFQANYPADNFGKRMTAILVAPETGAYTFWTGADDSSELWLSTTSSSANRQRIAYNTSNTAPGVWNAQGTQQSAAINLVAGQRYYIEVLHRDQTGDDHVAVAWQTPSLARHLIPNECLEYPGSLPNRAPWLTNMTLRAREDGTTGTPVGNLLAGDFEAGSVLSNFVITGGNTGNAFSLDPATGLLSVNGPLSFASMPKYLLDVRVTDSGALNKTAQIAVEVEPLAVKREYWTGISGNNVSNLTSNGRYPSQPNSVTYQNFFETPTNSADNYGQRLTGYLRAPDSGSYTFWIASDDGSELWLSTDTTTANRRRIAYTTGATGSREWGKYTTQKSATIQLEGGKFYYIEALHKEGTVDDNLAVSWQGPDFSQIILGTPHVTQSFYNHGAPQLAGRTITVFDRDDVLTTLEAKDWSDPGTTITYTITGGNADGAFSINPLTGVLTRNSSKLPVGTRNLTITATDNGIPAQSTSATIVVNVLKAGLKREIWRGLNGSQSLADLTNSIYFPHTPDSLGFASNFQAPVNFADNYGQRLSGYLIPPATANYTFWIASDDGGELWLSTDASPANKRRIAYVNGSVSANQWTAQGNQQSVSIPLVAGQAYYIEALQKEGGGGDHLSAAWQSPSISRTVISSAYLEYPDELRPVLKREDWLSSSPVAWARHPATGAMEWSTTLISEAFEGTGTLAGNTTETGGATWGASAGWLRNGGIASKSTSGNAQAFVPFSPQPGNVYTLSLEIDPTNNPGSTDWLSLGFVNQPATNTALYTGGPFSTYGQAWMLARANGNENGNTIQAFSSGLSNPVSASIPLSGVGTYDTLHVILDTRPANWISSYYVNGTLAGGHTFNGAPNIQSVGFGGFSFATGNVRNFRLVSNTAPAAGSASTEGNLLSFKGPSETADNFSRRITGFIVPPTTGDYTLWIASDDDGQLLLSTDEDPANLVPIASLNGYVAAEAWDIQASQKSAATRLVAGRRYFVEVRHRDGSFGDHVAVAWEGPGFTRSIISNGYLEHPSAPSDRTLLKQDVWTGVTGNDVSNLTSSASYPGTPSTTGTLPSLAGFATTPDTADNYGERLSGFLVAPEDGRYTFWIASDDSSELWLSCDEHPANRARIALVSGNSGFQNWEAQASQKSVPIALVAGRRYYVEALHKEGVGGDHVSVAWQGPSFTRQIIPNGVMEHPLVIPGSVGLKREVWNGISGSAVANLTSASSYTSAQPSGRGALTRFEAPTSHGDNYGQRITGLLVAPESGNYKFWIASDDTSELWLSTDTNPANRIKIAQCTSASSPREWTRFSGQESGTLPLVAGQKYHIEVLHKEGTGNDHLAVAWQGPSFSRQVIDGRFLEYPGTKPAPVFLKREIWNNVGGNNVSNLTSLGSYPNSPGQVRTLLDFETPVNEADNYGQKISGYLIAPFTGNYQFWIASDDGSDLNLATDGNPTNKTRIAYAAGATGRENWTSNATQASAAINLVAGQRYYIEVLHKEGGGDDYASVAWSGTGTQGAPEFTRQILRRQFLEYPGLPTATTQSTSPVAAATIDPSYTFWLNFNGVTGNNRLAEADPDGDGIPNSLEFVLGGRPSQADSLSLLPTARVEDDWLVFEFRRADVSTVVDPFAQLTDDFLGWTRANHNENGIEVITENDAFGPGVARVTVRVPRTEMDKLFIRLNSNLR